MLFHELTRENIREWLNYHPEKQEDSCPFDNWPRILGTEQRPHYICKMLFPELEIERYDMLRRCPCDSEKYTVGQVVKRARIFLERGW